MIMCRVAIGSHCSNICNRVRGFDFLATERDKAVGGDEAEPDSRVRLQSARLGRRFDEIGR